MWVFGLERVVPPLVITRADKGWAVKRSRPSKKVWCSGLGLCLEMSLVFDFGQGLRCGLSMALPLSLNYGGFICFLALLPRSFVLVRCLSVCGRFSWSRQTSLSKVALITSMTPPLNYFFVLLLANVDVIPKQKQLIKYCLKDEGRSHPCHPWQN